MESTPVENQNPNDAIAVPAVVPAVDIVWFEM